MSDLITAFDFRLPEMMALVGSGGKTSLMFSLAAEMAARGRRVVTTTTAKIWAPTADQSRTVVLDADHRVLMAKVLSALNEHPHVTMADSRTTDGKLMGIPPEVADDLFSDGDVDLIIVEADGSRGLPLKGPGTEEPAIPSLASIVVPVVGLGGLDRPLDKATTFRPERFGRLASLRIGQTVTPEDLARVLFHEQGFCRNLPEKARLVTFLNQADLVSPEMAQAAAEAAFEAGPGILDRVVWGSLNNPAGEFQLWPE